MTACSLFQVKCTYRMSGCSWTGGLGELGTHLRQDCPCILVECTNMCGSILQRQELPTHKEHFCLLRKVHCKYCSLEGAYKVIISEHYDVCPKVPVACPNSCSNKTFPREELLTHVENCPLEKVSCHFQKFGCNEIVARKDMDEHMSSFQNSHLLLTLSVTARLQHAVESCKTETAQLKEELQKVRSNQQHLNRQHANEMSATSSESVTPQSSFSVVERHLAARANHSLYEPIFPLIIQMTNFEQEKHSRRRWVSTPFYTEPFGYKLCLCVYANGCCSGEGTHLSVYIHLMAGEFDDELEWPAEETITVELQNQLHSTHNHWVDCSLSADVPVHIRSRVRGGRSRARWGSGTPTFIPLSKLSYHASTNCQYKKNDCLYFYIY